jgi:methylmalonyl-CoA mutase cobalamin-binding domain/chain
VQNESYKLLIEALIDGDRQKAQESLEILLNLGVAKEDIVVNGIHKAMEALDNKCTAEQFNLLELMLTGRAVATVIDYMYHGDESSASTKETIVLASLEGDIHDLGKGIVKTVLIAKGYKVIDCGKDVAISKVIETSKKENAKAICISGLISSVIPQVKRIKDSLHEAGLDDIAVLAGGAALKQVSAETLNVDFVGETAFDAGLFLDKLLGHNHDQS